MGQQAITPGSEKSVIRTTSDDLTEGLSKANLKLRDEYTKLYGGVGTLVFAANKVDGMLIMAEAEQRATELILVAQLHPKMLKWLKQLIKYNAYIGLGVGHMGIVFAILANHDRLPPGPLSMMYNKTVEQARDSVATIERLAQDAAIRQAQGNI